MPFGSWWQGLQRKLSRRSPELRLSHRNLYILPSRFGGLWLLTAAVLYWLGINSRSNSAVLLAFLMAAVMLLSMFLTHLNLQGLTLRVLPQQPCLAGEATTYSIETDSLFPRPSLKWRWLSGDAPSQQCLHLAQGRQRLDLIWQAPERGVRLPGRLLLHTTAPLGLFRCWCYWEPPTPIFVAPAPRQGPVQRLNSPSKDAPTPGQHRALAGSDNFQDLKPWRPEEGLGRIDWKALARGRSWMTKSFASETPVELWLAAATDLPQETALEHLCHQVFQELTAGGTVGLLLPDGRQLPSRRGPEHLQSCLRALAEVPSWP